MCKVAGSIGLARLGRVVVAVMAGGFTAPVVGCGSSHGIPPTERVASVRAAQCPSPPPRRSTGGAPRSLAPDHPIWTTFCVYSFRGPVVRQSTYPDGPLDGALNGSVARLPAGHFCPTYAGLDTVVVLTYRHGVRDVVIRTGGCLTIVLHNGSVQHLFGQAGAEVMAFYERGAPGKGADSRSKHNPDRFFGSSFAGA
jgi:hypothetical protein